MKKTILLMALVGIVLTACEKKNDGFTFREDTIWLNGVEQPKFKSTGKQYSVAEIVRLPEVLLVCSSQTRGFSEPQRDTINNRLMMWSTDVLREDEGEIFITYEFIGSTDVHLISDATQTPDTVGYIPQSVIDNAREQIEALYAQERFDEIYELFHTAFVFYPCTGQEYKDIMASGGN